MLEIARPRLLDLLGEHDRAPVRMLCAPHGGGKTTALRQYAAHTGTGIVTLPPNASSAAVAACLEPHHGAALTIIDQADGASPAGRDTLFAIIEEHWPRGSRYLLAGSSRTNMRAQALIARGVAALIDASQLAFSSADIASLAAAQHVAADEIDVEQLRYDTDGWPLAVAWIVRDAARDGRALRGAYEHWRERNGHLLLELVTAAHADDEYAKAFVSAVWSLADPASQRTLERLDAEGFPIVRMRTGVRPYRVLMQIACDEPGLGPVATVDTRLILNLFGRFSCTIANRPVVFDRRRDQNVLTYVALAPGATVTRAALLEAFWPDATRAVASQGLRTTLCRLRRAIADAAGVDAGRYVRVDNAITLDLDWVSIDARTFRAYIALAEIDEAGGNQNAAREHYLKAEQIYTGALLASEALEDTLAPYAAAYAELFENVVSHLVAIYARDGNANRQRALAERRALRGAAQPA